jgi:hypothetical protein
MPMTRYHIISAPLCSPLRFIINRAIMQMIKKCRWYDGDAGDSHYDDPEKHQTRCADTRNKPRAISGCFSGSFHV